MPAEPVQFLSVEEVLVIHRRLVERFPADTAGLNTLGALALVEGERDAARSYLERSLAVDGQQPRVRELLQSIDGPLPPPAQ